MDPHNRTITHASSDIGDSLRFLDRRQMKVSIQNEDLVMHIQSILLHLRT
jgi:hypothetical protein